MPFGDGTGRLGRGRNCDTVAQSDRMGGGFVRGQGRGFGRGVGQGSGRGRGQGFGFRQVAYQEPTKADEKAYLDSELKSAEEAINVIKKRLQELK